jgi:hypothetical protein
MINAMRGMRIAERFALDEIALAHERMERGGLDGRVVLEVGTVGLVSGSNLVRQDHAGVS